MTERSALGPVARSRDIRPGPASVHSSGTGRASAARPPRPFALRTVPGVVLARSVSCAFWMPAKRPFPVGLLRPFPSATNSADETARRITSICRRQGAARSTSSPTVPGRVARRDPLQVPHGAGPIRQLAMRADAFGPLKQTMCLVNDEHDARPLQVWTDTRAPPVTHRGGRFGFDRSADQARRNMAKDR